MNLDMFQPEAEGLSRRGRRRLFKEMQRARQVNPVLMRLNLSADTTRLFSPALWFDCPEDEIIKGLRSGVRYFDDFINADDEDGADSSYLRYIDTGNTIRALTADTTALATGSRGGVLRLATDATDNDSPIIQYQSANGAAPFLIGNTSGAAWPLWFEARIRKASITDNQAAFFCGLAQVGAAANDGLLEDNSGDLVNSISAIGFRVLHDNGEELDFAYQDAGQTAPTEAIANITAMVASTWIKVGFKYTPMDDAAKQIKIFVNNQCQATYITTANIDAATFPENDPMTFVLGLKNGEATATSLDIDWVKCIQSYTQV